MSSTFYHECEDASWGTADQCAQYGQCMEQNVIYGAYHCVQDPQTGIVDCDIGPMNYQQAHDLCYNQYLVPPVEDPPPDMPVEDPPVQYYDPCASRTPSCLLL